MRPLFGVDFAAELDNAFQNANGGAAAPIVTTGFGSVTFVKSTPGTRTAGHLTAGRQPTLTSYPGIRCFVADMPLAVVGRPLGNLEVESGDAEVKILANSLPKSTDGEPSVVPEIDDQVSYGGKTRVIYYVKRSTSGAVYLCYVR